MVTRTLAYAVAAACAVAIAVPVVVAHTGRNSQARLASVETAQAEPGEGARWQVIDRDEGDVDGDGTGDQVRVRRQGGEYGEGPVRLEVELSGGELVWTMALKDPLGAYIAAVIQLGGSERAQVVVWQTPRALTRGSSLRVFGWQNGELVELPVADEAVPFGGGFEGRGAEFTTYWTKLRRGRLVTFRTPAGEAISPHAADMWEWQLRGGALSPEFLGTFCQNADHSWTSCP